MKAIRIVATLTLVIGLVSLALPANGATRGR